MVTKLDEIRNKSIKGAAKVGEIAKKGLERRLKSVVWSCDVLRGAVRRKESDGNKSTRNKEEMMAEENMVA